MTTIRLAALLVLTATATYVVAEWSVLYKSGLHDLRAAEPVEVLSVPVEPERLALLAQVDKVERTFGEYRDMKERHIAVLMNVIANLERQIQVLTAQRPPEQVAALRAASRPVRWTLPAPRVHEGADLTQDLAAMARAIGFTRVEVRR